MSQTGWTWRVLTLLGKIALDRIIGTERTNEVVELVRDWRQASVRPEEYLQDLQRSLADQNQLRLAAVEAAAVSGTSEKSLCERLELDMAQAATPALALQLAETVRSQRSDEAAASLLVQQIKDALPTPGQNTYLLWLEPPVLEGQPGFCHFSYAWNSGAGQHSWVIRDYRNNGLLYKGPNRPKPWPDGPPPTESNCSALEVWQLSRGRIPAYSTAFGTKEAGRWRCCLEKLSNIGQGATLQAWQDLLASSPA